jgi:hypothetical protein
MSKMQKEDEEQQNKNRLFILSNGLSKNYINDLKKAAIKTKFNISEYILDRVKRCVFIYNHN